jgi:hypothetical protein
MLSVVHFHVVDVNLKEEISPWYQLYYIHAISITQCFQSRINRMQFTFQPRHWNDHTSIKRHHGPINHLLYQTLNSLSLGFHSFHIILVLRTWMCPPHNLLSRSLPLSSVFFTLQKSIQSWVYPVLQKQECIIFLNVDELEFYRRLLKTFRLEAALTFELCGRGWEGWAWQEDPQVHHTPLILTE